MWRCVLGEGRGDELQRGSDPGKVQVSLGKKSKSSSLKVVLGGEYQGRVFTRPKKEALCKHWGPEGQGLDVFMAFGITSYRGFGRCGGQSQTCLVGSTRLRGEEAEK